MSFIVRIYRFSEDGPAGMVGAFTGIQELGEILAGAVKNKQKTKT